VLYLHANRIEKVSEIRALATLPKLVKLTLHGNPVEEKKNYRRGGFTGAATESLLWYGVAT
jgi:hypothetical protein